MSDDRCCHCDHGSTAHDNVPERDCDCMACCDAPSEADLIAHLDRVPCVCDPYARYE